MSSKLQSLSSDELLFLLNQERKKFMLAIDYGSSGSDLQEIRDIIKEMEAILASRTEDKTSRENPDNPQNNRRSVA